MFTTLITAFLFAQRHAPKDVPISHWAYTAVDELFAAGLLDGYDQDTLRIMPLPANAKWILAQVGHWSREGWLTGYPAPSIRNGNALDSPYEQAVAIHTIWVNLCALFENAKADRAVRAASLREFDDLVRAISMRSPELTKLQGDPQAMVSELARIRSREHGTVVFRG